MPSYPQNLVRNGSFEERQYDNDSRTYLLPINNGQGYQGDGKYHDEVTRCIGDYDWVLNRYVPNRSYPEPSDRNKTFNNGGCRGWYNPLDESESTPDYFNRGAEGGTAERVDVPDNIMNNYGIYPIQHKQEPCDDNNNQTVDYGQEDAYIGLQMIRIWNNPNSNDNYSEFITQRLSEDLQAFHGYNVRFRVSWTYSANIPEFTQTGHYLKGIGAYFSYEYPFDSRRVNSTPLDIDDGNIDVVYDKSYFTTNPKYYDQTGGTDGRHWDVVEYIYQPLETRRFITIGNFQKDWSINNRLGGPSIPSNNVVVIYYFIDSVCVEEIPGFECSCSHGANPYAYELIYEQILKQPSQQECCYKLAITPSYDVIDICRVNRAVVCTLNAVTHLYEEVHTFTNNGNYLIPGQKYNIWGDNGDYLCFPKSLNGTLQTIKVKLYNNDNLKCEVLETFTVECKCGCELPPPDDDLLKITKATTSPNPPEDDCCWNFSLENNSDCQFGMKAIDLTLTNPNDANFITVSEIQSAYPMENIGPGIYRFLIESQFINPTQGHPVTFAKICTEIGKTIEYHLAFITTNDIACNSETGILECVDCCQQIQTTITSVPDFEDGTSCCFKFVTNFPFNNQCRPKKFKIFNLGKVLIYEASQTFYNGYPEHVFCVNKSVFGFDESITIKIKYYDENDVFLCDATGIINKCYQYYFVCKPDFQNIAFNDPPKEKTITFMCNGVPCDIHFTYLYRNVTDGQGNSIYRDVQILSYDFPVGCNCEPERVNEMLKEMWNDLDVKTAFGLYNISDNDWPRGSQRCFMNYRVISSDCWEFYWADSKRVYTKKCDMERCCFAKYRVCYWKDEQTGQISLCTEPPCSTSNYTGLTFTDREPWQCTSPCDSRNCQLMLPHDDGSGPGWPGRIGTDDEQSSINGKSCNVSIKYGKNSDEIKISLECGRKGNVQLILTDILGNIMMKSELKKNSFSLSVPVDEMLLSGIYLLKIKIDGELIYSDKLIILK